VLFPARGREFPSSAPGNPLRAWPATHAFIRLCRWRDQHNNGPRRKEDAWDTGKESQFQSVRSNGFGQSEPVAMASFNSDNTLKKRAPFA
jgi:hypothetical protein